MRQIDCHDVDAMRRQQRVQLPDPLVIRAIATPDGQRALVEPEGVAALDRARRLDASDDRDPQLRVASFGEVDLASLNAFPGRNSTAPASVISDGS